MLGPEAKGKCTICIDDVGLGDEVVVLPCKHWFHDECVELWLNEHNTCPICRASVEGGGGQASLRGPRQHQVWRQGDLGRRVQVRDSVGRTCVKASGTYWSPQATCFGLPGAVPMNEVVRNGIARSFRLWIRLYHGPQESEPHLVGSVVPDPTSLLYVRPPFAGYGYVQ